MGFDFSTFLQDYWLDLLLFVLGGGGTTIYYRHVIRNNYTLNSVHQQRINVLHDEHRQEIQLLQKLDNQNRQDTNGGPAVSAQSSTGSAAADNRHISVAGDYYESSPYKGTQEEVLSHTPVPPSSGAFEKLPCEIVLGVNSLFRKFQLDNGDFEDNFNRAKTRMRFKDYSEARLAYRRAVAALTRLREKVNDTTTLYGAVKAIEDAVAELINDLSEENFLKIDALLEELIIESTV
jgi:hypothetical protein